MGCLSSYLLQIISCVTVLLVIYFCDQFVASKIRHSMQMAVQRLSTINMAFSDKDKILIRSLYLKGYTANRLTYEFPEKRWTKRGVNRLLKRCGTEAQFTGGHKFEFLISQGSVATCLR